MSSHPLPSLFLSHGPPTMVVDPLPLHEVLAGLGRSLPRPKAVLAVSAHWLATTAIVGASERPTTIHDFFGFPPALYRLNYPAPGAPALARRVQALLQDAGFDCGLEAARGLDHGVWEPLMLMYPQAEVPVVPLALPALMKGEELVRFGRALAPLRAEGVLVMASGTAVHNLEHFFRQPDRPADWASVFEDWLVERVEAGDEAALIDYRRRLPEAKLAHPSEDHYLPLLVALGAGGGGAGRTITRGFAYASLSMAAFAFGDARH